ncbi:hypothetical protein ACQP25_44890 (plasmid) [Microtetraspora malaysiensis]|uniref:hypothetical protein n=1 Tax=Microtetraspora malaysiensis TaxID=161358 RepID=UPI003D915260
MNDQPQEQAAAAGVSPLRLKAARAAGRLAAAGGKPIEACPYKPGPDGGVTPLMEAFVYAYNQRIEQGA